MGRFLSLREGVPGITGCHSQAAEYPHPRISSASIFCFISLSRQMDQDFPARTPECTIQMDWTCGKNVEAGTDPYTVKELLGHQSISITERYSHLGANSLRRAVSLLENAIRSGAAKCLRADSQKEHARWHELYRYVNMSGRFSIPQSISHEERKLPADHPQPTGRTDRLRSYQGEFESDRHQL